MNFLKSRRNKNNPIQHFSLGLTALVLLLTFGWVSMASAAKFVLSTRANNVTLGGVTFNDEDLVIYDTVTNTANLLFDGSINFGASNRDINAVHFLPNGNLVLSTINGGTLGGQAFADEDLVEYNPTTNMGSLFFDGSAKFTAGGADLNAIHVLSNGNLVLSTTNGGTLGGQAFADEDLVEYNPTTNMGSLFFDGNAVFTGATTGLGVDAVLIRSNGNIVLSTNQTATLGGVTFQFNDLVEYNPNTNMATLVLDGKTLFGPSFADDFANISAVSAPIPEPSTMLLLGSGLVGLIGYRMRKVQA